jgi:transposase
MPAGRAANDGQAQPDDLVLVAWSHPGRCRSEAAFAALADVSPLEASSGRVTRHRLNRFGDRHLNRALHTIVNTCPTVGGGRPWRDWQDGVGGPPAA